MSNSIVESNNLFLKFLGIFITLGIFFSLIITENYFYFFLFSLLPFVIILIFKFENYWIYYLFGSLFIGVIYIRNFQIIHFVALSIIYYYFIFKNPKLFNHLKLPLNLKFSSLLLILLVIISSIRTPHYSLTSIVEAFLFLIYITTGYVIFRSIKDQTEINKIFNIFFSCIFISALIIVFQIFITLKSRSVGLAGYAIMDLSACALIMLLLQYVFFENFKTKNLFFIIPVFIIFITTQSRFAWLSFILTFIYIIIILLRFNQRLELNILKKLKYIFITIFILILILFAGGLNEIIQTRVGEIKFEFFQPEEDAELLVSNSLESRILIWIVALEAFKSNSLTGVGYHMFMEVSETYNVFPEFFYEFFIRGLDAHSTFLNFLTETGILGLLSFLIFIVLNYIYSFKSLKLSNSIKDFKISIILNSLIFFFIINSTYSGAYTLNQNAFFMYIVLGLNMGNYLLLRNKHEKCSQ